MIGKSLPLERLESTDPARVVAGDPSGWEEALAAAVAPELFPEEGHAGLGADFQGAALTNQVDLGKRVASHSSKISMACVREIMSLLHGEDGFHALRRQGAALADAWSRGAADLASALDPSALSPATRYGVMRYALEWLTKNGHGSQATMLTQSLSSAYTGQSRAMSLLYQRRSGSDSGRGHQERRLKVFQLFEKMTESAPTVRLIFDALAELGGPEDVESALLGIRSATRDRRMGKFWAHGSERLEHLATQLSFCMLLQCLQSVMASAANLLAFADPRHRTDLKKRHQTTKALLDMAGSPAPGSYIEKLAAQLLAGDLARRRLALYSHLWTEVQRWHVSVWANPEIRSAVLKQLQARQALRGTPAAGLAALLGRSMGTRRALNTAEQLQSFAV